MLARGETPKGPVDHSVPVLAVRKPGIPLVQVRLVLPANRPRATDAVRTCTGPAGSSSIAA